MWKIFAYLFIRNIWLQFFFPMVFGLGAGICWSHETNWMFMLLGVGGIFFYFYWKFGRIVQSRYPSLSRSFNASLINLIDIHVFISSSLSVDNSCFFKDISPLLKALLMIYLQNSPVEFFGLFLLLSAGTDNGPSVYFSALV